MLAVLILYLFCLAIISYYISGKDLISPTFVLCILFLISVIFGIVGNITWKSTISITTIFLIIINIFLLFLGEVFARYLFYSQPRFQSNVSIHKQAYIKKNWRNELINFDSKLVFILIVIDCVLLYLYFRRSIEIAIHVGYSGTMLIQYIRVGTSLAGLEYGPFFAASMPFISSGSYVCLFILINNIIADPKRQPRRIGILLLVPSIISFFVTILSGARVGFIQTIIIVCVFYFILNKIKLKIQNVGKMLLVSTFALFIILLGFSYLGTLTGKTDDTNYMNNIYVYAGSSIFNLDDFVSKEIHSLSFGQDTFIGIRTLLNFINPNIPISVGHTGVFDKTAVYTAFRAFYSDFRWFSIILSFFIGFSYSFAYFLVVDRKSPKYIVVYALFFQYFVYIVLASSVTSTLFSTGQVFSIFWALVLGKLIMRNRFSFYSR